MLLLDLHTVFTRVLTPVISEQYRYLAGWQLSSAIKQRVKILALIDAINFYSIIFKLQNSSEYNMSSVTFFLEKHSNW